MENGPFIDGLPNLKMGGSFHGCVTNNQMVVLSLPQTQQLNMCELFINLDTFKINYESHVLLAETPPQSL